MEESGLRSRVDARSLQGDRGVVSVERRSLKRDTTDEKGVPVTSTAIETAKILSFDIAALWSSLENSSYHPGFLLHDGPREAEMDAWVYRRFFTFARKLEEAYPSESDPAFQYVITTTEPPPSEMQTSPWPFHSPLSAHPTEERLMRTNLK